MEFDKFPPDEPRSEYWKEHELFRDSCLGRYYNLVCADIIHELELGTPHNVPLTPSGDVTMAVTLIDANHCPGSVMFLFEGYFGRILYTGDFRYSDTMLTAGGPLTKLLSSPVDVLYLDNTFCSPKCAFPPHDDALKTIVSIIEQHPSRRVMFGMRSLGKEDMLIRISEQFNEKIAVSSDRYKVLEILGLQDRFVLRMEEGDPKPRFEVVSLVEVTRSNVDGWNKISPTIAILPTALFEGLGFQPFANSTDIFVVPYSDHSPYAELQQFVAGIRPKSVIPIVRADVSARDDPLAESLLDRANVECFADFLDRTPMQNYHIPASVLEMMNQTPVGTGQTKKRAPVTGTRRQRSKRAAGAKSDDAGKNGNHSLRTLSVSSDNLESALAETSIEKSTTATSSESELQSNGTSSQSHLSARLIQHQKPHVLVKPMKRCSSSDRLLALAMRPSPYMLKQRVHRVAGTSHVSHPASGMQFSGLRPRAAVSGSFFSIVHGRRDRLLVTPHRLTKCSTLQPDTKPDLPPLPATHVPCSLGLTSVCIVQSESDATSNSADCPLNLSQSASMPVQSPVSQETLQSSDASTIPCVGASKDDFMIRHLSKPNCSTGLNTSAMDFPNFESAALAVSSLLSLSSGDPNGYPPQSLACLSSEIGPSTQPPQANKSTVGFLLQPLSVEVDAVPCSVGVTVGEASDQPVAAVPSYAVSSAVSGVNESTHSRGYMTPVGNWKRREAPDYAKSTTSTVSSLSETTCISTHVLSKSEHGYLIPGLPMLQLNSNLSGSHLARCVEPNQSSAVLNASWCDISTYNTAVNAKNGIASCVLPEEPQDYSMTSTTVTDSICELSNSSACSDCILHSERLMVCNSHIENANGGVGKTVLSSMNAASDVLPNSVTNLTANCDQLPNSDCCGSDLNSAASKTNSTGSSVASQSNCTVSIMLPPKKSWRRRYHRSAQLNRAHQENKCSRATGSPECDRIETRSSFILKRAMDGRAKSPVCCNNGVMSDVKDNSTCKSTETCGEMFGSDASRSVKRCPLIDAHSFSTSAASSEIKSNFVGKSVLKSDQVNTLKIDNALRQVTCLPSASLLTRLNSFATNDDRALDIEGNQILARTDGEPLVKRLLRTAVVEDRPVEVSPHLDTTFRRKTRVVRVRRDAKPRGMCLAVANPLDLSPGPKLALENGIGSACQES